MIINIFMLVLLINCKISTITSARLVAKVTNKLDAAILSTTESLYLKMKNDKSSTETTNNINMGTTEVLDLKSQLDTTEDPFLYEKSELQSDSLILDDFEKQLKDIFVVTLSTRKVQDEFNTGEMETTEGGKKIELGRRTNFRTRLNCRCVIRNRCARSDSCLREDKRK